ncbi:DUF2061 domain-containing protein [Pelagibius sp.]|uniref:DUF2061 domain-containing protein n=1 Tax=Pelagibius sp. TaxID=1931238 RepID=UPI003B5061D5
MTRDLAKTASFAVVHFAVGFGVTYALTGSVVIATGVALIEPAVNTVAFFFHERAWERWGRGKTVPAVAAGAAQTA